MYQFSIENGKHRAYSTVTAVLDQWLAENKIKDWRYKKPIFVVTLIEGVEMESELAVLASSVQREEDPEIEEIVEAEVAPVPEPVVEAMPVPEPVVEVALVPEPPPKPVPVDPRNKKGTYALLVWTAEPAVLTPEPTCTEIVESRNRPWAMMEYKKFNNKKKGKYPDKVVRVELWFEGKLIDRYPEA